MPDNLDPHGKDPGLSKKFKEFSFGEAPDAPVTEVKKPAPPLPPVSDEPVKLTKEDMDFTPYRGPTAPPMTGGRHDMDDDDMIAREEEEAWEQREHERRQDAAFEAAGSMFRLNREVTNVLTLISNLEMQSIVTAGLLEEHYGDYSARRRNDMMIAALALNAANFDDIAGELTPECVEMVDAIRALSSERNDAARLAQAQDLPPDAKRILVAETIADLEMALLEMTDGEDGPTHEEQASIGAFLKAVAPGVDRGLRKHAIDAFNDVSKATDNGATLKEKPDGAIIMNAEPDIIVETGKPAARAKNAPAKKKPSSGKKQPHK